MHKDKGKKGNARHRLSSWVNKCFREGSMSWVEEVSAVDDWLEA